MSQPVIGQSAQQILRDFERETGADERRCHCGHGETHHRNASPRRCWLCECSDFEIVFRHKPCGQWVTINDAGLHQKTCESIASDSSDLPARVQAEPNSTEPSPNHRVAPSGGDSGHVFIHRPIEVEARQFDGTRTLAEALVRWIGPSAVCYRSAASPIVWNICLHLSMRETVAILPSDWIVKYLTGTFSAMTDSDFMSCYSAQAMRWPGQKAENQS